MSKKKKSKSSAPAAPSFTPSEIRYGDQVVGRTYMDNGQIVNQYFADPAEQERKKVANERINQILPTLGQTAPEIGQRYDQMRDDYIGQQTDLFNKEYDKTLKGLREDVVSRFGTTNATPYYDKMTELERDVRAPAYLDIQRTGSLMRKDLDTQEQQRKLQELSALGYTLSADQQAFLSGLNAPIQAGQYANNFNQQNYLNRLNAYNQQQQQRANATNSFLGFLGRVM